MGVYSICKGLRTVLCDYGYCTSAFGERKVFLSPLLISIESLLTIKGCKKGGKKGSCTRNFLTFVNTTAIA